MFKRSDPAVKKHTPKMNTNSINQELTTLRHQISGRDVLLQEYNQVTTELSKLPKEKENFDAILALNKAQENLLKQLKENKKLQEKYLQKINEKAALIKTENPNQAEKLLKLETSINEKETVLLGLSESVTAVTELLNELGKLTHVGGKAKSWGFSILLGKLFEKPNKHAHLQEAKEITMNIRKLTRRYKKELGNIKITKLPDLPIRGFIGTVEKFASNVLTQTIIDMKVGSLLKKSKNFEQDLLKQLELLEEQESAVETLLKKVKKARIQWIEKS